MPLQNIPADVFKRRRRNALPSNVAIHRLPNEVLSNIFRAGLPCGHEDTTHYEAFLTTIPAVCFIWRNVALHTPCLWTHASMFCSEDSDFSPEEELDSLDMTDLFLSRSGALPIHLKLTWSSLYGAPCNTSRVQEIFNKYARRIKSIAFRGQAAPDLLPALLMPLPTYLPALTTLEIRADIISVSTAGEPRIYPDVLVDAAPLIPLLPQPDNGQELGNAPPLLLPNDPVHLDYATPWHFGRLRAPRLRTFTYRAYTPTRAFADFIKRSDTLDTLALRFDVCPYEHHRHIVVVSSDSLRELVVAGDVFVLDSMLGSFPKLVQLSTLPHNTVQRSAPSGLRPIPSFPKLRSFSLRPWTTITDEDVEFILGQDTLSEIDLDDGSYPEMILDALIDRPAAPVNSPTVEDWRAQFNDQSRLPTHPLAPLPISPRAPALGFTSISLPDLRHIRITRSRKSEVRFAHILSHVAKLLAQRPNLCVTFVGGTQLREFQFRVRAALLGMMQIYGRRVRMVPLGYPDDFEPEFGCEEYSPFPSPKTRFLSHPVDEFRRASI